MNILLNEQQQKALDGSSANAARVIDARTNSAYVLVPESEFETVREIIEDERRQRAIREVGVRNAVGRMEEAP